MSEKPKFNPFANALASTPKYVENAAGPGMDNTLFCTNCGAAREGKDQEPLVCRYCGTKLEAPKK